MALIDDLAPPGRQLGVLFVCLGNICRSPLAQGIFIHHARARGQLHRFDVDSAGTGGWHAGERPDPRALAVAAKHRVELPSLARQFDVRADPSRFQLLVPMDRSNFQHLARLGVREASMRLMLSFDPETREPDVPDPYYGPDEQFDRVFDMLRGACNCMLDELLGPDAVR